MKVLIACLLSTFTLFVSSNPAVLKSANDLKKLNVDLKSINDLKDLKLDGVDYLTCVKCEIVVQIFHFLNDAVIGGAGEEEARQTLLALCPKLGLLKDFCVNLTEPKLWDTIYKALRDSLGTFYTNVGMDMLHCPALDVIQKNCE